MSDPSWPSFLDHLKAYTDRHLDADRDRLFAEFYKYADVALRQTPPRPMRGMSRADFEDMLAEIKLHCVDKDFAVLRRYRPMGRSFAAFLYVVAHNFVINRLKGKPSAEVSEAPDLDLLIANLTDENADPAERAQFAEVLEVVNAALAELSEHHRQLIILAADELLPREIVDLLGPSAGSNKKVSDGLRYAREMLRNALSIKGIDINVYLPNKPAEKTRRKSPKTAGG